MSYRLKRDEYWSSGLGLVVHGLIKLVRPTISDSQTGGYRCHDMPGESYRGVDTLQADGSVRIKASSRFRLLCRSHFPEVPKDEVLVAASLGSSDPASIQGSC